MEILFNYYIILILRILHVGGGIMWVGSAALYLLLLIPVARITQAAGAKFLRTLGPKFGAMMGLVTTVTVISGALLYARYAVGGLSFIWTSSAGIAFTIGAIAALGSYALGVGYFGKTSAKIAKLGAEMQSESGAPAPAQIAEMSRLQSSLLNAYRFDFVLLVIAAAAMAVARYL